MTIRSLYLVIVTTMQTSSGFRCGETLHVSTQMSEFVCSIPAVQALNIQELKAFVHNV